jgi:hypothetical protein
MGANFIESADSITSRVPEIHWTPDIGPRGCGVVHVSFAPRGFRDDEELGKSEDLAIFCVAGHRRRLNIRQN